MKEPGKVRSDDSQTQKKSFLGWWGHLTDYVWELFKYNLCFLLFVLPSFLCLFIFLVFNAQLFLIAGLILLIPAGPAILAIFETTSKIATGGLRSVLPRFFYIYKKHWRSGFVFGLLLAILVLIVLYPFYFAVVTNSVMKPAIMICATIPVLFSCCLLPHIAYFIISGEHHGVLKKSIMRALHGGKASFFAGLLQAVWLFSCIIYPYISFFAALLGMSAIICMTAMYILPQVHEE